MPAKQAYFHGVAQHRLGLVAQASKNYGEAVARMKVSSPTNKTHLHCMVSAHMHICTSTLPHPHTLHIPPSSSHLTYPTLILTLTPYTSHPHPHTLHIPPSLTLTPYTSHPPSPSHLTYPSLTLTPYISHLHPHTLTHSTLTPSQKALELMHDAERRGEGHFKAYVSVTE